MANTIGLSAAFLLQFSKQVSPDDSTTDVCVKFVLPATKPTQCAYVDLIKDEKGDDGRPVLGAATVFVSHAWKYKFLEVLDVMLAHAEKEPQTYFWFDLFINNQNLASTLPQEWWSTTFKTCIQTIGTVLLVMSPWNDPIPLTRAWCLWEIMCAIDLKVRLLVQLPRAQQTQFLLGLVDNFEVVLNTLVTVRAERAEAFLPKDRAMIFETIEKTVTFPVLNQRVKEQLRQWFLQTTLSLIATLEQQGKTKDVGFATLCSQVGNFLHNTFGAHETALKFHDKALSLRAELLGDNHPDFAASLGHMALVFKSLGEMDKTTRLLEKSLAIQLRLEQDESVDLAMTFSNLGNVYAASGNYDKAVINLEKGLNVFLKIRGEMHDDTCKSFGALGMVYQSKGELDKALEFYNKCLEIQLQILNPNHPSVGITYDNLGSVYLAKKQFDKAQECFEKCLLCRLEAYESSHPDIANSYNNIAAVLLGKEQYEEAITILNKSLTITINVYGETHPTAALIRHNLARAFAGQGNFERAIREHQLALSSQLKSFGETHPETAAGFVALAAAFVGKQDIENAHSHFVKGFLLTRAVFGEQHPRTHQVLLRVEMCRQHLEAQKKAAMAAAENTAETLTPSSTPAQEAPTAIAVTTTVTTADTLVPTSTARKLSCSSSHAGSGPYHPVYAQGELPKFSIQANHDVPSSRCVLS